MANFCSRCGTGLDMATGLCPNCDREQLEAMAAETATASAETKVANFCCVNRQCSTFICLDNSALGNYLC